MAVTFNQIGFRGRNDDGSETTATWKAATNTNWQQATGTTFRLRFDCDNTGTTGATLTGQLQVAKNAGTFQSVTGSSTIAKAVTSSNITDDQATTQQISSGTFVAGKCDINDGLCAATASISTNVHTELEFCLQINAADVVAGDVVHFRVVRSTSTLFTGTYTSPTVNLKVTLTPAAGAITLTGQTSGLKKIIAPSTGALVLSGQTSTITNIRLALPAAGALSLSGRTSSLSITIRPAVASLSLSGLTSKLKTTLSPANGTIILTGQTSTVIIPKNGATTMMLLLGAGPQ